MNIVGKSFDYISVVVAAQIAQVSEMSNPAVRKIVLHDHYDAGKQLKMRFLLSRPTCKIYCLKLFDWQVNNLTIT